MGGFYLRVKVEKCFNTGDEVFVPWDGGRKPRGRVREKVSWGKDRFQYQVGPISGWVKRFVGAVPLFLHARNGRENGQGILGGREKTVVG